MLCSARRLRVCAFGALLLAGCSAVGWAAAPLPAAPSHPKTCLVLSGGGARGVSHIGVLRALEEQHIPIDCIAGTSMGAIVGGLYSAGYSAAELDRLVRELDWSEQFDDRPPRTERSQQQKDEDFDFPVSLELGYKDGRFSLPKGTVGGVGFERMLARLTRRVSAVNDFNRLPIPFRAVATDLVSGEGKVFDQGSLAQAMRASMSVPGAFAPIEVDGHIYADGGLVSNLPVDAARAMGAERIIAVNIGTPLASKENLGNVLGVTRQMISILAGQNVKAQLAKLTAKDVLITPALSGVTSLDFPHAIEGIDAGYRAAKAAAPALAALALDDAQWQAHLAARPQPQGYTGKLAFVDVQGTQRSNPDALLKGISTVPGDDADDAKLQADAARILGRGDFERVDYRLTPAPAAGADRFGATFNVMEKTWGVDMFRLGLGGSTDFEGGAGFDVLIGHRRAWMNEWGGEWRNRLQLGRTRAFRSEFVQPLSSGGSIFVAPKVEMERRTLDQFQGNQRVSQWVGGFDRVGVDLGMPVGIFGTLGEARIGVAQGRFRATQRIGSLGVPDIHFTETGLTGSLVLDQLSDAAFPREGWRVAGSFFNARHHDNFDSSSSGGRDPYTRWQGNALGAFSLGRNTWQWGLEMGGFLDKSRLGYSDFRLGGFQRLSGYRNDQIDGNFMALGKVSYRYRFAELTPFGRSIYGGGSLELGNAWANRDQMSWGSLRRAGSLFLAADTPLGPAYVALGFAEGGNRAVYLFLGRP